MEECQTFQVRLQRGDTLVFPEFILTVPSEQSAASCALKKIRLVKEKCLNQGKEGCYWNFALKMIEFPCELSPRMDDPAGETFHP